VVLQTPEPSHHVSGFAGLTLPGGIRADLPGKLNCLWRAGSGSQKAQNDLYRLQHALTRSG